MVPARAALQPALLLGLLLALLPAAASHRTVDANLFNTKTGLRGAGRTNASRKDRRSRSLRKVQRELMKQDLMKQDRAKLCHAPEGIAERYESVKYLNRGARGCAYLTVDKSGGKAVLKVAVEGMKAFKDWTRECVDKMQRIHTVACKHGQASLQLVEQYLPTCLESGASGDQVYLLMQAAPMRHLVDLEKDGVEHQLTTEEKQSVFAQLVAALAAMHGIGYAHNDFHDKNIMVEKAGGAARVAVIDFGRSGKRSKAKIKNNLDRDARALLKHLAMLVDCKGMSHSSDNFEDCVAEKWDVDEEFVTALRAVVDGCQQASKEQHIGELYRTTFVQEHLPSVATYYHLPGNCE